MHDPSDSEIYVWLSARTCGDPWLRNNPRVHSCIHSSRAGAIVNHLAQTDSTSSLRFTIRCSRCIRSFLRDFAVLQKKELCERANWTNKIVLRTPRDPFCHPTLNLAAQRSAFSLMCGLLPTMVNEDIARTIRALFLTCCKADASYAVSRCVIPRDLTLDFNGGDHSNDEDFILQ